MADPTRDRPVFDHVAVAVEAHEDAYPRYVGDLGGLWRSRGYAPGFAPSQVEYGNGMRVEILQPNAVEQNDFLRRFIDRHGPGPHHLTFKVFDIETAMAAARDNGIEPINVDLSDPGWKEAFLHPKQACGIVVQLAQTDSGGWISPDPPALPASRPPRPADLDRVVVAVPSLADGLHVFERVLGGAQTDEGDAWVELAFTGPGRLRLIVDAGHTGLDHIAFTVDEPAAVPGAQPLDSDDTFEVPAGANDGVRLVLRAR